MATIIQTQSKIKNKEQDLQKATNSNNIDKVLENVKKVDNTCSFTKCKNRTTDFAIECKHCSGRFCATHGLPEIHGCGEAVKREEKRNFLHPKTKLSQDDHTKAATKLAMKLKQMEFERKAKQGSSKKRK